MSSAAPEHFMFVIGKSIGIDAAAIPGTTGYFTPEVMVFVLSTSTRLEEFELTF
jgi:hypothetical protein